MKLARGLKSGLMAMAVVALAACSGDDGDGAGGGTPSTTTGTPTSTSTQASTTLTTVLAPATTVDSVAPATTVEAATTSFVSAEYKVDLRIPSDWPDPDAARGVQPPFFFLVGAADNGGEPLSDFCQISASHRLLPYGSAPTVTDVTAGGQPGCLIEPSDDQPESLRGMGELVVRYPTPIQLPTGEYGLFVLHARVPELRTVASSLTFNA